MPTSFTTGLERVRRRIRLARTAGQALRWTFYAALVVCACVIVLKVLALGTPSGALAALVIGSVAVFAAGGEIARRFSSTDCAILLDRKLGLEERLSTALVAAGPMADALRRDAERAWSEADPRAAVPRVGRETGWLAGTLVFLAVLFIAPSPTLAPGGALDPELAAVARREARRLRETGDPALAEIAQELEEAETPEGLRMGLRKLGPLETAAAGGREGREERQKAIAASGAALSAALAERGELSRDLGRPPRALARKLDLEGAEGGRFGSPDGGKGDAEELDLGEVTDVAVRDVAEQAVVRRAWDPEYDEIVANYYEVRR
ncbi:MAG: hypothetical protein ACYTAF_08850 [Planctomycetota bacterium]|jgi:hypothetical protein